MTETTSTVVDDAASGPVRTSEFDEENETNDQGDRSCLLKKLPPTPPISSKRRLYVGENVVVIDHRCQRSNDDDDDRDRRLRGVVAHLGPVDFSTEDDLVGVQLIAKDVGKGWHDGVVQGKRYFTAPPRGGVFVPRKNVAYSAVAEEDEVEIEDSNTSTTSMPTIPPIVIKFDMNLSSAARRGLFASSAASVSTLGSGSDTEAPLVAMRTQKVLEGAWKRLEELRQDQKTSWFPRRELALEEKTATKTEEENLCPSISVGRLLEQNQLLTEEIATYLTKQTSMQLVIDELRRELFAKKEEVTTTKTTTTMRKKQDGGYGTEMVMDTETETEDETTTRYSSKNNRKPRSNRRHRDTSFLWCRSLIQSSFSLLGPLFVLPCSFLVVDCSSRNGGKMYKDDNNVNDNNNNCVGQKEDTGVKEEEKEQEGVYVEERMRNRCNETMTRSCSIIDKIPRRRVSVEATATATALEERTTKQKVDIAFEDEARHCENLTDVKRLSPGASDPTSTTLNEHKQDNEDNEGNDHKDARVYRKELRVNSSELTRIKQQYKISLAQNARLISTLERALDGWFTDVDMLVTESDNKDVDRDVASAIEESTESAKDAQRRTASAPKPTSTNRKERTKQGDENHDFDNFRSYRADCMIVTSELVKIKLQHRISLMQNEGLISTPEHTSAEKPTLTNGKERKQENNDHDHDYIRACRKEVQIVGSQMEEIKRQYKVSLAQNERLNSMLIMVIDGIH